MCHSPFCGSDRDHKVFSASGHMSIPEEQDLSNNLKGSWNKQVHICDYEQKQSEVSTDHGYCGFQVSHSVSQSGAALYLNH